MTSVCTGVTTDYDQVVLELHRIAANVRQPVSGTFEFTDRCNLACRMCYICQSSLTNSKNIKELSGREWVEIARQAVDNGMVFLLLTGGEVFLRADFFNLYFPLTRLGLIITLFSNGTLITETVAARLAEAPPSRTEITLYGATETTYETISGVPGSYARCCNGIEALIKNSVPLSLKTTLTQQNAHELDAMQQMARNWGLSFTSDWLLTKRRDRALTDIADCRLSAVDCVKLELEDHESTNLWTEIPYRQTVSDSQTSFNCIAGRAAFNVNPRGEMNVCIDLPLPAVPVLEIGFCKAWEQVQNYVDSALPLSHHCQDCSVRSYCSRCPAWSLQENGTLNYPVPYLCEIAQIRKNRYSNSQPPA
ncbi:MAG: radical SAM protein [Desulfobulbaceae bacterium]|nr:radical SAM protein [Desulfobulbaceae bacterium]